MTKETILEQLKKASGSAAKTSGPATETKEGEKVKAKPSGDEIRQSAYRKAMGNSFINKENVESVQKQLKENFDQSVKFGTGVTQGSIWAYRKVLRPIGKGLTWPIWWPVKKIGAGNLVKSFNKWVWPVDEKGVAHLSVNRAGAAVIAFGVAAYGAVGYGPYLMTEGVKDVTHSTMTGLWYGVTHQHVKMVMHSSRTNEADELQGVAEGCFEMPCTQSNSQHFIIDDSGFHQFHSIVSGNGIYDPRRVVAAVADTYNLCEEDIYGAPHKIFYKWGLMNPRLLDVTACYPMEQTFDPNYIKYINNIIEAKGGLAESIKTVPFPGSIEKHSLTKASPTIAPK